MTLPQRGVLDRIDALFALDERFGLLHRRPRHAAKATRSVWRRALCKGAGTL